MPIIIASVFCLISLGFFRSPIHAVFKLLANTAIGFFCLVVLNYVGSYINVYIAINMFNAVIIAALGPFGVGLIIALGYVF